MYSTEAMFATRFVLNPLITDLQTPVPNRTAQEFHTRLPGYASTPLVELPRLAQSLGVRQILAKDESERLGLPSFKILGAAWAIYRALSERIALEPWHTLADLAAQIRPLGPLTFAAATDGNHGRAVAYMARLLGCSSRIFVPGSTSQRYIQAVQAEGSQVIVVDGGYDDAVVAAAGEAADNCLVICDVAWKGYEAVPQWVIEGYSTIFAEIDATLGESGQSLPDIIMVQIGVGALAAAVVQHYRRAGATSRPRLVGVEPITAACMLGSIEAGRIASLPGIQDSMMTGLNCGTPSLVAWPLVSQGLDLFIAIDDGWSCRSVQDLAAESILTAETGAAGLAGLSALLTEPHAAAIRQELGITADTRILVLITEGISDSSRDPAIGINPSSFSKAT